MARLTPARRRDMAGKASRIASRLRDYIDALKGTDDGDTMGEHDPARWMLDAAMACDNAESALTDDMPDYGSGGA